MRKCFACKQRIPLGDAAKPFVLDDLDRKVLNLKPTRGLLYFHPDHYWPWLESHVVALQAHGWKPKTVTVGLPSWHRRE